MSIQQAVGGGGSMYWGAWDDGGGAGNVVNLGTVTLAGSGSTWFINGDMHAASYTMAASDDIQLNGSTTLTADATDITLLSTGGDSIYSFGASAF